MNQSISVLDYVPELRHGIARRSVRDLVAEKIATLIAWGILQVGDTLPSERELAVAFRVSRETVRGGMQILAVHGIIEISHGARTRVVSADVDGVAMHLSEPKRINNYDIDSIHAARQLVERQVIADAARHIDEPTLKLLEDILAQQRHTAGDPVRFLIIDREFHTTIYRACGNPPLADFVSDLYAYMMEYRRKAMAQPGAILKSYEEHRTILDKLRAHDLDAAVEAFNLHSDRIYATTRSLLDSGKEKNQSKD